MTEDSIIIRSRIKDFAKIDDKPINVSGDFGDKLNQKAVEIIKEACRRAKDNGRNTVMSKDL